MDVQLQEAKSEQKDITIASKDTSPYHLDIKHKTGQCIVHAFRRTLL